MAEPLTPLVEEVYEGIVNLELCFLLEVGSIKHAMIH